MAESPSEQASGDTRGEKPAEGLSLDALSRAFHAMLGPEGKPEAGAAQPETTPPAASPSASKPVSGDPTNDRGTSHDDVDAGELSPKSIVEAMLFVGDTSDAPLESTRMASLIRGVSPGEIDELVRELNAQYASQSCPYHILPDGAGYRMVLRDEFRGVRDRYFGRVRQARLSQAAIEVLAIVAYNEPLTRDDVSRLRGKPSGRVLAQLVRRRLLRVERDEQKRAKAHYLTTKRFLDLFGLETLADLPRSQEIDRK